MSLFLCLLLLELFVSCRVILLVRVHVLAQWSHFYDFTINFLNLWCGLVQFSSDMMFSVLLHFSAITSDKQRWKKNVAFPVASPTFVLVILTLICFKKKHRQPSRPEILTHCRSHEAPAEGSHVPLRGVCVCVWVWLDVTPCVHTCSLWALCCEGAFTVQTWNHNYTKTVPSISFTGSPLLSSPGVQTVNNSAAQCKKNKNNSQIIKSFWQFSQLNLLWRHFINCDKVQFHCNCGGVFFSDRSVCGVCFSDRSAGSTPIRSFDLQTLLLARCEKKWLFIDTFLSEHEQSFCRVFMDLVHALHTWLSLLNAHMWR